jgi:hypothetical protein
VSFCIARTLESHVRTLRNTQAPAWFVPVLYCVGTSTGSGKGRQPDPVLPNGCKSDLETSKMRSPEMQWLLVPNSDRFVLCHYKRPCHGSSAWLPTFTAEIRVQIQASPCEICGGDNCHWYSCFSECLSFSVSVPLRQYYTN